MRLWRGYVLIEKPPALTGQQWRDVLTRLYAALNHFPDAPYPQFRLHWRLRPDNGAVIFEAYFLADDLDINNLARLPAYLAEVLPYSPAQVRDAMRQYITIAGGTTETSWAASHAAARAYLAAHADEWEIEP